MSTQIALLLFNFIVLRGDVILRHINCIDQSGNNPSYIVPLLPEKSTATCPVGYTVTACGAKAINLDDEDDILGSYISGNGCQAKTRWSCVPPLCEIDEGGIRVHARCCNLNNYGSSFQTYTSSKSGNNDDDTATISCASNTETLIGCIGYVDGGAGPAQFDGTLIGPDSLYGVTGQTNNICRTKNGKDGNGVYAKAICYDKSTITDGYELDCIMIWGTQGLQSTVSCPTTDYFMTSCNGYSAYSDLFGYIVENNICTVTYSGNEWVIASAICCRMYKHTPNPTQQPTVSPTSNPTKSSETPTFHPTNQPTYIPTKYPTFVPTNNPTSNPTYVPTNNPTINPTYVPTTYPSTYPTNIPSIYPTINPSDSPTILPTKVPTTRPTLIGVKHSQPTQSNEREDLSGNTVILYVNATDDNNTADDIINRNPSDYQFVPMIIAVVTLLTICCIVCIIMWTYKYFYNASKRDNKHIVKHIFAQNEMSQIASMSDMSPKCGVVLCDEIQENTIQSKNDENDNEFIIDDDDDDDDDEIDNDICTPKMDQNVLRFEGKGNNTQNITIGANNTDIMDDEVICNDETSNTNGYNSNEKAIHNETPMDPNNPIVVDDVDHIFIE